MKSVLEELNIPIEVFMKMICDNQTTISIAKNPVHNDKTKHEGIVHHFIQERLEGIIVSIYTLSSLQTTDILTKALPRTNFEDLSSKLGMINIYKPA